jgi:uncharacterized protein
MRFVLDVHLGKLARHLRMLGFDSAWQQEFADPDLLKTSQEEGRILLTRDRQLHEQAPAGTSYYVQAIVPAQQLVEVLTQFKMADRAREGRGFLSRCLECNREILPVSRTQIEDRLPAHVREEHEEFFLCPRCERIYWKGSHFDRMHRWVTELLQQS